MTSRCDTYPYPIPILTLAAPSLAWTIIHPRCLTFCRVGWDYCSGGGGRLIAWGGSIATLFGDAEEVILLQEGRRRGRKVPFCAIDLTVAIKQSYPLLFYANKDPIEVNQAATTNNYQ